MRWRKKYIPDRFLTKWRRTDTRDGQDMEKTQMHSLPQDPKTDQRPETADETLSAFGHNKQVYKETVDEEGAVS